MGTVYHEEGSFESAFILYSKFITLFVEKLPNHPEYKEASAGEKAKIKKKLLSVFPLAEQIKKQLSARYEQVRIVRHLYFHLFFSSLALLSFKG